jgi:hypothetical protein
MTSENVISQIAQVLQRDGSVTITSNGKSVIVKWDNQYSLYTVDGTYGTGTETESARLALSHELSDPDDDSVSWK